MSLNITFSFNEKEQEKKSNQRIFKGFHINDFIDNYVVMDFETTGLDPSGDSIIDIGALKVTAGEVSGEFKSLVNPGFKIGTFITNLTGITNAMLTDAPSIQEVLPLLLDFIGNYTVVGHNINFDINFLYDNCMRVLDKPFENNYIDTVRVCRNVVKGLPSYKLDILSQVFCLSHKNSHRALDDCYCAHELYEYLKLEPKDIRIEESLFKSCKKQKYVNSRDVITTKTEFDENNPLYGKICVITGALEKMTRADAMQMIVDLGGIVKDGVTKNTDYLILGNNDYNASIKGGKSSKHKKAEDYILKGYGIEILSENVFYDMIDEN